MKRRAIISDCGNYRYRLSRRWAKGKPCLFIMLNPSKADMKIDDRTIKKCIKFSEAWGCGKLYVGNLFAYRTSKPTEMKKAKDPIGPDNRRHLRRLARKVTRGGGICIAAWGVDGKHLGQNQIVVRWFRRWGKELHYLELTKDGHPKHPLYLLASLTPTLWNP